MFEEVIINYFHPGYNIGLQDIRNAWLLSSPPIRLHTCIYRGNLIFRIPVAGKRISYRSLRKGLIKKDQAQTFDTAASLLSDYNFFSKIFFCEKLKAASSISSSLLQFSFFTVICL